MGVVRTIWLLAPLAATLISTVLVLLVYLQQLSNTGLLRNLHFLTVSLNGTADATSISGGASISSALNAIGVARSYDIGLWNYCTPSMCSAPQAGFYFNPLTVWHLNATDRAIAGIVPNEWQGGLDTYAAVSKWMFAAYTAAVITSALALLNGILAFWMSRLSACCTALLISIAAAFSIAASATATALFGVVKTFLDEKLHAYGVTTEINTHTLGYTWSASAFAILAALGWTIGMCCSGAHKKSHHKGSDYDRLVHPEHGPSAFQMKGWTGQPMAAPPPQTAYEPYRPRV